MTQGICRIQRLIRVVVFPGIVLVATLGSAPGDTGREGSHALAFSEAAIRALKAPPAELSTNVRRELEGAWRDTVESALTEALSNPEADISTKLLHSELAGKPYLRFFAGGYEPETGRKVIIEAFHGAGPKGVDHHYGKWFRPITLGNQSIEPIDFSADRAVLSTLTDDLSTALYWQAGAFYVEVRTPEREDTVALAQRAHDLLRQKNIYEFAERAGAAEPRTAPSEVAEKRDMASDDYRAETEPNNDRDQATGLAVGEKVRAKIAPQNDGDWYRVNVDRQGALAVKIDPVPENLDVTFQVFDGTGNSVQYWVPTKRPGQAIERVVDLKRPGTYYLEVRDGRNNASSPEPYELALAFSPTADPAEPNDTRTAASPIAIGSAIEANILPLDDADWYWLSVGSQGALEVTIPRVPPELDVTFQVFDGAGNRLQYWVPTKGAGQPVEKVVDLKTRGTYYLEVRDGRNNGRSSEPYRLALRFTATRDDGEPNDSPETALPIAVGETVQANILPLRDGDWYRVEVEEAGELTVKIHDVPAELDLTFQVFDEAGNRLQHWAPTEGLGKNVERVVRLPGKGVYDIEVRDGRNNARSSQPYSLSTAFSSHGEQ